MVESIVENRENAGYQHFPLIPRCLKAGLFMKVAAWYCLVESNIFTIHVHVMIITDMGRQVHPFYVFLGFLLQVPRTIIFISRHWLFPS